MKKIINILILLVGFTIQAQLVGVLSNTEIGNSTFDTGNVTGLAVSSDLNPGGGGSFTGIAISDDGFTYLTVTDGSSDDVTQWAASTAFDVTSISTGGTQIDLTGLNGGNPNMQSIEYNDDGTKVYIADLGLDGITQFSLSTAWDFTSQSFDGIYNSAQTVNELGVHWEPDGGTFYILKLNSNNIYEYTVSVDWDLTSTVTYQAAHTMTGGQWDSVDDPHSMQFINDGYTLIIKTGEVFAQHDMFTAYDLSTNYWVADFKTDIIPVSWLSGTTRIDPKTGVFFASRYNATQTLHKLKLSKQAYKSEYLKILDYAFSQTYESPSLIQKVIQNKFLTQLKVDGVLAAKDALYVFATDGDSDYSLINWKNPTYIGTANGGAVFNINEGWKFDGTNDYLLTGFNLFDDTVQASVGDWSGDVLLYFMPTSQYTIWGGGNSNTGTTADELDVNWLSSSNDFFLKFPKRDVAYNWNFDTSPEAGFIVIDVLTTDANDEAYYFDGTSANTRAHPTTPANFPDIEIAVGAGNYPTGAEFFGNSGVSLWMFGASERTQQLEKHNAVYDYITNINDIFPQTNAASLHIEIDGVFDWVEDRNAVITLDTSTSHDGDSSIKIEAKDLTYGNGTVILTGLENGATYEITYWAKADTNAQQYFFLNSTFGWTADTSTQIDATTWTKYTTTGTTNATQADFSWRATAATVNNGDLLWVDGITITKQ